MKCKYAVLFLCLEPNEVPQSDLSIMSEWMINDADKNEMKKSNPRRDRTMKLFDDACTVGLIIICYVTSDFRYCFGVLFLTAILSFLVKKLE